MPVRPTLWQQRHRPWVMLWPLSLAQMTTWGTLFFSFPLFSGPMQRELGWSATTLNSALTCGLLVTGFMAYPVGARLDRDGGRLLMTVGSLGAGCLLLAWSRIDTVAAFYLLWLALGVCLSCCLVEPLFAVVNQNFGTDARRGITVVTMITGLAGTVYVPLIGALVDGLGWRATLLVLAALNLGYSAPVHWLFIPARAAGAPRPHPLQAKRGRVVMRRRLRNPVFWGLALWYTSYSLTGSSIIFQFVPLLRAEGIADRVIFAAFALIGPAQLVARLLVITVGKHASIARLGAVSSALVPLALLLLIFSPHSPGWLVAFALCFAAGHGVTTILRGTAPIEWLGREHFGRTMGAIALPMQVALALAPTLTAWTWAATGSSRAMLWQMFFGALAGVGGYWIAVVSRRRARRVALGRVTG